MCVLTTQCMSVVISLHPHKHEYYEMAFLGFLWKQVLRQIGADEKSNQSFEKKNHNSRRMLRVEISQCFPTKSPSIAFLRHVIYSSHKIREAFFQLFSYVLLPSTSGYREGFTDEDFWLNLWRMFDISLGENGDMAFSGSEKYAVSLESSHGWKVKRVVEIGSS